MHAACALQVLAYNHLYGFGPKSGTELPTMLGHDVMELTSKTGVVGCWRYIESPTTTSTLYDLAVVLHILAVR